MSRRWFECWRDPPGFFCSAWQQIKLTPLGNSLPNHLCEAYVAGLFARIWSDHYPCKIRLFSERDRFPDAQLREGDNTIDFEIALADNRDRRMWEEHKKWAEMYERREILPVDTSTNRQKYAREAIPRICKQKIKHYLGAEKVGGKMSANLLIHLMPGRVLAVDEMAELAEPYKNNFESIWLLCGIDDVQVWPDRKVLGALQDPFDCVSPCLDGSGC